MNNEMMKVVTENRLGIGANKIATNDSELSSGKLVKSTPTGISSANLSDHLEGTPGQIVVSPYGTGGAKVGFPSGGVTIPVATTLSSTLSVSGNTTIGGTTTLNGTTNIKGDTTIGTTASGGNKNLTVNGNADVTGKITGSWDGDVISVDKGGTGQTTLTSGAILVGNGTGNVKMTKPTAGHLLQANGTSGVATANLTSYITGVTNQIDVSTNGTTGGVKIGFPTTGTITIPTATKVNSTLEVTGNTTIGSSSAPATLNVYGKSTLRDRLTVPKDGSNNTSGIIDAWNSYYLGGTRWIHGSTTCTAVGYLALQTNPEGSYNSAMGSSALYRNTKGSYNSAMGYYALKYNTEGSCNSAMGSDALNDNRTGSCNSAIGCCALRDNRTGYGNSAIGYLALYYNTEGSCNSAMGYCAGRYVANGSTYKTTGDNNLYLGSETKAKENGTNNEIVIGANAIGLGSNSMVLGHTTNLLTALRGKVGIGKNDPTEQLNSINNIKADAKLIAGTHVDAGGNVTAVETVQGKNLVAVQSNSNGGDISADNNIDAGNDITAQNNVTGFVVNAIKDINAGNNITATETVTGKNLVATQSITAGTTIDAGGNITSDGYVEGNYVRAVLKNGYGGDVYAANDVIASRVVSAGYALNTTMTDPLNEGEVLIHDKNNYPNNLGSDVMLSGISTDDRYIVDTSRYIEFDINLPMFQVETLLAYKIITIDNKIIREEGISIVSTISTLLDGNGIRMQRHKVLSHHCIGYRPSVSYVDIWDNALAMGDANNPGVNDAILQGDFFSFDRILLENNKLSPVVEFTDLSAFVDNYNLGTTFKIDYSYRFNVNAFGSDKAVIYATK